MAAGRVCVKLEEEGERRLSASFPFPNDASGLQRFPRAERATATTARREHPKTRAGAQDLPLGSR